MVRCDTRETLEQLVAAAGAAAGVTDAPAPTVFVYQCTEDDDLEQLFGGGYVD